MVNSQLNIFIMLNNLWHKVLDTIILLISKMPLQLRNHILKLRKTLPDKSKGKRIVSLYDKNLDIKQDISAIVLKNRGNIVIGDSIVKCWIPGVFSISNLRKTRGFRINEHLSFTKKGLFCDKALVIAFTSNEQENILYIDYKEFFSENTHYYAFRTGSRLFVSNNLADWEIIYEKKRGIKNSMLFTKRGNEVFLIFIEYTPGTIRERHRILEYGFSCKSINVVKEFHTYGEYLKDHNLHCCRHIHVIDRDPYTNDIYVGTGDNDIESAIWVSRDNGLTYDLFYRNGQIGRTLSFMFTKDCVYWTTDTHEPQFIVRYNRYSNEVDFIPLINGALWHSFKVNISGNILYVIGSNSEGAHFDNKNRVYGISLENDTPRVFELLSSNSWTQYDQLFPVFVRNNEVCLYDIFGSCFRLGKIEMK